MDLEPIDIPKIGLEKYTPNSKTSAKMCKILLVLFGRPILGSFLVISGDLPWKCEIEPVELHDPHNPNDFYFYL